MFEREGKVWATELPIPGFNEAYEIFVPGVRLDYGIEVPRRNTGTWVTHDHQVPVRLARVSELRN